MRIVFVELKNDNEAGIESMSELATAILREHYDPIVGVEQNDYMLEKFQSVGSIREQLAHGYRYFFVMDENEAIGFIAFYERGDALYVSKFYLRKERRGEGIAHIMLGFVKREAVSLNLGAIELNVNKKNPAIAAYEKLGFTIIRKEKNDIGEGYFMDDYVMRLDFEE